MYKIRQRAFTLVELLITLAVTAILVTTALPYMGQMLTEHRLKAAGENLYQSMLLAREEAMKQNTTMHISFATGSSWCFGARSGSACSCTTAGNCTANYVAGSDYPNTSLALSGFGGGTTANFDASRGLINNTGTITLSSGGLSFQISISKQGIPTICTTGIWGYSAC